jgi:hypothetical protein
MLKADIYVKQKINTDPVTMMGKTTPAIEQISETWISGNKFVTIRRDNSIIIDLEKKTITQISHKQKAFLVMTIPIDLSKYYPEQMIVMLEQMMKSIIISVKPNEKSKTINNWECQGYDVQINMKMMGMPININMIIWASTKVPFDWQKVNEKMTSQIMKISMRLSDDAVKEMNKIQGYAISIESKVNMMKSDIKSQTQVIEISEKAPPENIYSVPPGYTEKEKLTMQDLQR